MKNAAKFLGTLAAILTATAIPALANSGAIKVTVASDTPYQAPPPVAAASTPKFQVAPIKMQNPSAPAANTTTSAPTTVVYVHPHWR
jgi:hypothetical protein